MLAAALAALLPLLPAVAAQASYPLVESFQGKTFLDGWRYPDAAYDNTTNGDVAWATAANTSLIYVNDDSRVVLKVDTGFVVYNEKRYAPKLVTKNAYNAGTVWVMDATHMPYGCSVWPAFWTQGPNWPAGGEIDIVEGVNGQTDNQVALHTQKDGCYASSNVTFTGSLSLTNCSTEANSGSGCIIKQQASDNSYGANFATAGGGVYVTEYAEEYIKIWFLTRSKVPSTLTADAKTIDTSTLGEPAAYYPSSSCKFSEFFGPQTLTLDITLCGDWAGSQSVLEATCPALEGTNTCYTTYVINNATAADGYKNAYFEINYINIYASGAAVNGAAGGADAGSSSSTSGSSASASSGSSGASTTTANTPAASTSSTAKSAAGRTAAWGSAVALLGAAVAYIL